LPKNSYIFITHLHRGFPGSWQKQRQRRTLSAYRERKRNRIILKIESRECKIVETEQTQGQSENRTMKGSRNRTEPKVKEIVLIDLCIDN
jgi:hypothetical protein